MTAALGLLLGLGLLLAASPFLWPRPVSGSRRPRRAGARLRERLVLAGLGDVGLPVLLGVTVAVALGAAALAFVLVPVLPVAAAAGVLGLAAPATVLRWRARSRRRANRLLWPDVVDHLVAGVRSGQALPDALSALAVNGPEAMRAEFALFERDWRITGDFGLAIDALKARLADPVADRLLETLRMSREVGGSELPGVLRALAGYLRADGALRAEVEARQGWVVNAARLGVAAPWIVLVLLATRPEAAAAYNSAGGVALILVGLVLSVVAYRLMLGIGRLPEEQRYFS
ncbi:type II secretion system F family protein [Herbiconiux sp. SYSU D00978]|uniref:type II secretion system F family protein n=1 Tax=Herbiconiux sp. SYSU D00978 TaxID=2812562 RepID=UPI001A97237C|nr:type II secretion system F family protein [Herbiconiux sp. SYSU D00978]